MKIEITKGGNKNKVKRKKEDNLTLKPYKDFSKKIINRNMLISVGVLIFCCYEIHIGNELSALSDLINGSFKALIGGTGFYMVRALFKDKAQTDIFFSEQLSKLKKKFGDDFVQDKVEGVDTNIIN